MICYLNPIWTNSFIKHISEHALYIHFTVILGNKVSALNLCAKNLTLFFCSTYNQRVLIDCNPLCFYSPFSPRYKSSEQILFASCHFLRWLANTRDTVSAVNWYTVIVIHFRNTLLVGMFFKNLFWKVTLRLFFWCFQPILCVSDTQKMNTVLQSYFHFELWLKVTCFVVVLFCSINMFEQNTSLT